jgi:uncharacterized membrane protein YadS
MNLKEYLPGFFTISLIALLSYVFSAFHASIDPLVISITAGMLPGNLAGCDQGSRKGIELSVRIFIPAVIALYRTQICGASAIAVISPVIAAKREETSVEILPVMMLGLTGIVFFPIIFDFWAAGNDEFSLYAGTTLQMLGQVVVRNMLHV